MANYINLGSTCADFNEVLPSSQPYGTSIFYILSTNNNLAVPLKYKEPIDSTFESRASSNSVTFSDYQFYLWWNPVVIRSDSQRNNWRVLTKVGSASDNIGSNYVSATHGSNVITGSGWPSSSAAFTSIFTATYSADPSLTQKTVYIVPSSHSSITSSSNVFSNLIGGPPGYTSYDASLASTGIFYIKLNTGNQYLRYVSSAGVPLTTVNLDTNPVPFISDLSSFQFKVFIKSNGTKVFLGLTPATGGITDLTTCSVLFDGTTWTLRTQQILGGVADYSFMTSPPSIPTGEQTPTVSMFKFINTTKYLYWDGTFGNASSTTRFTIKDYWGSGLSTSNVVQGMQFYFADLQPVNAIAGEAGLVDWYKWYVHNSPISANQVNGVTNKANVISEPNGTVFVVNGQTTQNGYTPNLNEGWALHAKIGGSLNNLALVYSNVTSTQNPVAYANVTSDNVSWIPISTWSSLPDHAYSWNCFKCTPTSANKTCDVVSVGGGVQSFSLTGLTSPLGIAINGNYIYVVHTTLDAMNSGRITRHSLATGSLDQSTGGAFSLTGIQYKFVTINGNYIYAGFSGASGEIRRYNLTSGTLDQSTGGAFSLTGLNNPRGMVVNGGYIYVLNDGGGAGYVSRHILSSGALDQSTGGAFSLTGLGTPFGIAINGGFIYITRGFNGVSRYSLSSGALDQSTGGAFSLPGANYQDGIAINGGYIYLTRNTGNDVSRNILSSGALDQSTGGAFSLTGLNYPSGIAINGNYIYVVSRNTGQVTRHSLTSGSIS